MWGSRHTKSKMAVLVSEAWMCPSLLSVPLSHKVLYLRSVGAKRDGNARNVTEGSLGHSQILRSGISHTEKHWLNHSWPLRNLHLLYPFVADRGTLRMSHVLQFGFYFAHNAWKLSKELASPSRPPLPLETTNLFSVCMSLLLLFFFTFPYKRDHMVFVFFSYLTYFS